MLFFSDSEKAIEDERLRVAAYLNTESETKLLRVLEEEVLEKRESALLEKEGSGQFTIFTLCWLCLDYPRLHVIIVILRHILTDDRL